MSYRSCVVLRMLAALALVWHAPTVRADSQQPAPPLRPQPVETQRLDSLRGLFRTPTDTTSRARRDTTRLAANTARPRVPRRASAVGVGADSLRRRSGGSDGVYDVVLDVPNVSVDELVLQVDNLRAHVSLDARVAKLVTLSVGADVSVDRVHLGIRGVQAQAYLQVDLDNVTTIVDRVLTTLDKNPQIVEGLLRTVETTVATVGDVANTALQPGGVVSEALQTVGGVANTALQPGGVVSGLVGVVGNTLQNVTGQGGLLSSQGINALGQTVLRTVDATGRILERTVDQAGGIVGENVVGNVLQLPLLGQTRGASGQLVRTVQDLSGALIGVTVDAAGHVVGTDVMRAPSRLVGEAAGDVELPAGVVSSRSGRRGAPGVPAPGNVLANAVGSLTGAAAGLVQQLVLSSSLTKEGRTLQRVVELTGSIVERTVDPATGRVVSRKGLGSVLTLPLVREQMDPSGSLLRVVRDATGALIELTLAPNGMLSRLRLLQLTSGPSVSGTADVSAGVVRASLDAAAPAVIGALALTTWLIGQTTDSTGAMIERLVDVSGKIVERTVGQDGRVVQQREIGNVLKLAPVSETRGADGRVVRLVRDSTGTLLEVVLGSSGRVEQVRRAAGVPPR